MLIFYVSDGMIQMDQWVSWQLVMIDMIDMITSECSPTESAIQKGLLSGRSQKRIHPASAIDLLSPAFVLAPFRYWICQDLVPVFYIEHKIKLNTVHRMTTLIYCIVHTSPCAI